MSAELFAFLLASGAGLATLLGAAAALVRKPSPRMLSGALAFAAGAMVLVSLVEILPEAAAHVGLAIALPSAVVGALAVAGLQTGLNRLMPDNGNSMRRTGLLVALAIGLHNLPEGMAPFFSSLASPEAGIVIGAAIALHNIPEGVAIAVPLRAAGASRFKAFAYAAVAGLAESAGAGVGWAFASTLSHSAMSAMLAGVAGIMIWLSAIELIPAARRAASGLAPWAGAVSGAGAMALSLVALK